MVNLDKLRRILEAKGGSMKFVSVLLVSGFGIVGTEAAYADDAMRDVCHLEQNGTTIMDGACKIVQDEIDSMRVFDGYEENGGDFTYNNFVMAFFENDVATVYYNGGGGVTHAHALIGELPLNSATGCYESENAKFCAAYYEAPD